MREEERVDTLDDGRRSLLSLSAFRACDSFLQSSRPLQACDSSMRVLVAEVAGADVQSPIDALSCILALLEVATGFAGRHA